MPSPATRRTKHIQILTETTPPRAGMETTRTQPTMAVTTAMP